MNQQFLFVPTEDQSLTLRLSDPSHPQGWSESMHSLAGAFSETYYIYGFALRWARRKRWTPRIYSVGLGLGYNEILSTALFVDHPDLYIESTESVSELRQQFINWIQSQNQSQNQSQDKNQGQELNQEKDFKRCYEDILQRACKKAKCSPDKVRARLKELLDQGQLVLQGPLNQDSLQNSSISAEAEPNTKFNIILFDAFSPRTSPELWQNEFLTTFFNTKAAANCILTTYACNTLIQRSLRQVGFHIYKRRGFGAKRESLLALI